MRFVVLSLAAPFGMWFWNAGRFVSEVLAGHVQHLLHFSHLPTPDRKVNHRWDHAQVPRKAWAKWTIHVHSAVSAAKVYSSCSYTTNILGPGCKKEWLLALTLQTPWLKREER